MSIIENIKNEKPSKLIGLVLIFGFLAWLVFDTYKMFYPSTNSSSSINQTEDTNFVSQAENIQLDTSNNTNANEDSNGSITKPQMKYFAAISYSDVFAATQIIKRAANEEEAKLYVGGVLSQRTLTQQKERLETNAEIKQYEEQIARSNSEIEKLGFSSISEIAINGMNDIKNPVYAQDANGNKIVGGVDNRALVDFDIQVIGISQISAKEAPSLTIMVGEVKYHGVVEKQRITGGLVIESVDGKCVTISKSEQQSIFCLRGA
jgi:hypothetical protein